MNASNIFKGVAIYAICRIVERVGEYGIKKGKEAWKNHKNKKEKQPKEESAK